MFASYVFLRGGMEDAYRAEKTRRLVGIIRVPEPERLGWELQNLALALTSDALLDPYPNLVKGVRVEVVRGPFMGLQGVVVDRSRLGRVHLQVSMLGGGAALEMDAALVVPIE
jgi:transcription antitermination factor NusG